MGTRPLMGKFSTSRVVMDCPEDALTVSSGGASEVTVMLSVALPTVSSTFCAIRSLLPTWMPVCTYFLKPAASAESS